MRKSWKGFVALSAPVIALALCLPARAVANPTSQPVSKQHYRLQRRVITMALSHNPLVRIQCTISDSRGHADTAVWDPGEPRGLVRYVLLPAWTDGKLDVSLQCTSDRLELGGRQDHASAFAYYLSAAEPAPLPQEVTGTWKSLTSTTDVPPDITLKVTAKVASDQEKEAVLDELGGFESTSSLRSLDPTTSLLNDLLGTLAAIALDRASEAGKEYVRAFVEDHLCVPLTIGNVKKELKNARLARLLERLPWPDERRLLHTTCALLETARIDELVSAPDVVWRAVAADITALAGGALRAAIENRNAALVPILESAEKLMGMVIAGNTATTERDVQVLILELGRVGLAGAADPNDWQCALEAGMAVLRECFRDQTCPADELLRLLELEGKLTSNNDKANNVTACKVGEALRNWPELPTLLGRIGDVLRPAPGVDARMTAATAFELVLDVTSLILQKQVENARQIPAQSVLQQAKDVVQGAHSALNDGSSKERLEQALKDIKAAEGALVSGRESAALTHLNREHAYATAMIQALRAVVVVLRGQDPSPVIVELGSVLKVAILDECNARANTGQHKCGNVPINTHTLQRAMAVVNALASYGASYRTAPEQEDSAELQKQRAEQRRKALESVIDAFTDRSRRSNDKVFSFGAQVAAGGQLVCCDESGAKWAANRNIMSLPVGLAYQQLPGSDWWNLHVMISFLDLAQYATLQDTSDDVAPEDPDMPLPDANLAPPEPDVLTAVRLGLDAGLLFGRPSFPIAVTGSVAWLPRVTYEGNSRSEVRVGLSVGIYVPFLDLN